MRHDRASKIIAALLSAAMLLLCFTGCSGRLTREEMRGEIALASENYSVSGGMYAYFFFTMGYSYVSGITQEELDERGYDETKTFQEQMYDEDRTWYEYINEYVQHEVQTLLLLCEEAGAAGITLGPDDYAYINEQLTQLKTWAVVYNESDLNTYLNQLYFGYVDEEDLKMALLVQTLAAKCDAYLDGKLAERMTQERLDAHLATMTFEGGRDETLTRDLGHILVSYQNYDEDQAYDNIKLAKKRFEEAGKTEDAFKTQWKEFSEDANMVYDNLQKGDMVSTIDEWLFAPERQLGDLGIVTTEDGCHLLYYMEVGDPVYIVQAKSELSKIISEEMLAEMGERYDIKVKKKVVNAVDV